MRVFSLGVAIGAFVFLFISCRKTASEPPQFELLPGTQTGLEFKNQLFPDGVFNVFNYMYFYNGGGVSAADFNNDGLADLYFTRNMQPNKLFLNKGKLQFEDVSDQSGATGQEGWATGTSVVDINNDGWLDIYVSQVGDFGKIQGSNQLYVCQGLDEHGIPRYEDQAQTYGLDLVGFGTQAVFFDYDLDGDLDMYQLNHSLHKNGTFGQREVFLDKQHRLAGDKLMRNDNGKFVEVSTEAGILSMVVGYGLGIAVSDINLDGWPDIYVGNDFHENDYLYLNQQDGTFKEALSEHIRHTSRFSMGVDVADLNNDGHNEIISLDMLPYDPFILKSSLGEDDYGIFNFKLGFGYNHQYARNNLQLNNRNGTFSEIGLYAGVYATDWSWAPLFLDFNNDGYKDLFVANGIPKRMNDIDYVNFVSNDDIQWKLKADSIPEEDIRTADRMPEIKLPNKLFLNTPDLRFQDIAARISNDKPSFSNGAAYADFDNDGDLDIVVNNIDDTPFLYENLQSQENNSYLQLRLKGNPENVNAIGAKVIVVKEEEFLIYEQFPARGYQSSVSYNLHIGLGDPGSVQRIYVVWPDNSFQEYDQLAAGKQHTLHWQEGGEKFDYSLLKKEKTKAIEISDVTEATGIQYRHQENPFVEFYREQLIPHMTSTEGPALAVGDINGDKLEDLFIGASKRKIPAVFLQEADGSFSPMAQPALERDSLFEDVDAVFEDVNGDGAPDLVIASGGNEYRGTDEPLKPRLYVNDGKGHFTRQENAFNDIYLTASCVLPYDFTGDGIVDLFFGGRAMSWEYGVIPSSYLLANDGNGNFQDVTEQYGPDLRKAGLVKNGCWYDLDQDGDKDLLLAVEWGPVQYYINEGNSFRKVTVPQTNGWWNFLLPHDFDDDGDVDILAGNLGLNSKLKASVEKPVTMYINDFDDNSQQEQVLTYWIGDREIPFATYKEMTAQMPNLKKEFLFARDFAAAGIKDLFDVEKLRAARQLKAELFASTYFENTGEMKFQARPLPPRLQFAPLKSATLTDIDKDGLIDVALGGNYYENNIELGRYDADYGHIWLNPGSEQWEEKDIIPLNITGQVRYIKTLSIQGKPHLVLARNDESLKVLKLSYE